MGMLAPEITTVSNPKRKPANATAKELYRVFEFMDGKKIKLADMQTREGCPAGSANVVQMFKRGCLPCDRGLALMRGVNLCDRDGIHPRYRPIDFSTILTRMVAKSEKCFSAGAKIFSPVAGRSWRGLEVTPPR